MRREQGQFYIDVDKDKYILAQVHTGEIALISLGTGNRWVSPVKVDNVCNITSKEWKKITGGDEFFVQIKVKVTLCKK